MMVDGSMSNSFRGTDQVYLLPYLGINIKIICFCCQCSIFALAKGSEDFYICKKSDQIVTLQDNMLKMSEEIVTLRF